MIRINITKTGINIEGHAEYAEHGQDIVCAAVSAILQTAQLGLMQIGKQYPNNIKIKRSDVIEEGEKRIRSCCREIHTEQRNIYRREGEKD